VDYCDTGYRKGWIKDTNNFHGPLGITYYPKEEANIIADCLENQFISHDLSDENHEREVDTTVQALLAYIDGTPLDKLRPCDIHKLANSLKLRKASGLDGIPNECLRHLLHLLPLLPLVPRISDIFISSLP
jgi:hypothetical protein